MKNIVIIGAGPAGLSAAYELLKRGVGANVMIVEESNEIGGISKTVRHNGNRMDIGGHRFFTKNNNILNWWLEILPEGDPKLCDEVMMTRRRVSRIYYNGKFFDYPISLSPSTFINMGFVQTLRAGLSYLSACLCKLPETSLENFYINRFGRVLYSMFFESYTEKVWGRHPRDISADWGAQRVRGISISEVIKNAVRKLFNRQAQARETSLIESFRYPKFGPGQMWETVAKKISELGGEVKLCHKVLALRAGSVLCSTTGGNIVLPADITVSSMALKDLIAAMDNVPQQIRRISGGLPYRDFVTIGLLIDKLKLKIGKSDGLPPDCWIYMQDSRVKMGRIQIFNNWSPYMVADPQNTVWIGLEYFCNENDEFWSLSDEEARAFAVGEMKTVGAIDDGNGVLDFCRRKVSKAYPAYFDTYDKINQLVEWLNAIPNLYCIGRNGQHRYNNMDHSMLTGIEAARLILNGSTGRAGLWDIGAQREYLESK
jgi:protoporphyrinogen oxidase